MHDQTAMRAEGIAGKVVSAKEGAKAWRVTGDQAITTGEERRRDAILAFLGAGLFQPPSPARL
jgi:hypothetical protein